MNQSEYHMHQRATSIVFDIGNVLIQWDPRHLYRHVFSDAAKMEWFLTQVCSTEWNAKQDAGRTWTEAESELVASFPDFEREIRLYRARWSEMVPGPVEGMPEILEAVGQAGYRRYAVSNFAADTFEEASDRFPFLSTFEGAAISGRLGLLKPDAAIFHWLTETYAVDPTRAVYIDDLPENVACAARLGFQALHFASAAQLVHDLEALGVALTANVKDRISATAAAR